MANAKAPNANANPAINATRRALAAHRLASAVMLPRQMVRLVMTMTPAPPMINAITAIAEALLRTVLLVINATCLVPALTANATLPTRPMARLAMTTTHAPTTINAIMVNAKALNASASPAINATMRALAAQPPANAAILPRLDPAMITTHALLTISATMANVKALRSPALNPINVICLALAIVVLANAPILPRLALVMTTTDVLLTTSAIMANAKARL